jgi:hypothetical protein
VRSSPSISNASGSGGARVVGFGTFRLEDDSIVVERRWMRNEEKSLVPRTAASDVPTCPRVKTLKGRGGVDSHPGPRVVAT